jgi:hypothetical protein
MIVTIAGALVAGVIAWLIVRVSTYRMERVNAPAGAPIIENPCRVVCVCWNAPSARQRSIWGRHARVVG